jgi:hypothetical protein
MRSTKSLLAMLVFISTVIGGCGCLAADSYEKPQCEKYHTDWNHGIPFHHDWATDTEFGRGYIAVWRDETAVLGRRS